MRGCQLLYASLHRHGDGAFVSLPCTSGSDLVDLNSISTPQCSSAVCVKSTPSPPCVALLMSEEGQGGHMHAQKCYLEKWISNFSFGSMFA